MLLFGGDGLRASIDDTERTNRIAGGHDKRDAGIEADAGRAGDQRIVDEARVERGIGHDGDGAGTSDRVRAKRDGTGRLGGGEPDGGLEPLAVARHEGDGSDGGAANAGGEGGQLVEGRLRQRIEQAIVVECAETFILIGDDGRKSRADWNGACVQCPGHRPGHAPALRLVGRTQVLDDTGWSTGRIPIWNGLRGINRGARRASARPQ